jgi:phosphoribosylformimino-5-aminoimidazole carboxamide ribotide isomerase
LRVIGVLDLSAGLAVHARGGHRDRYAPVAVAVAGGALATRGDALALARAYVDRLGIEELYVADLDAITAPECACRGPHDPQDAAIRQLTALGVPVWLDAGVSSLAGARRAVALGAARVVVGLETLTSYRALAAICSGVGCERVAFSLDLRDGIPLVSRHATDVSRRETPERVAANASAAGAGAVMVIDLARVGAGSGLDLDLIGRVRAATPRVTLLAGGGLRDREDGRKLFEAGCDGVLVATALHDGGLDAPAIAALRSLRHHVSATR